MKKNVISVFIIAGLLSVLLSGCQTGKETGREGSGEAQEPAASMESAASMDAAASTEQEAESGLERQGADLPYQFAGKYGIIQSEFPVYELGEEAGSEVPEKGVKVSLTFAIHQHQELIVSVVLDDYSKVEKIPEGVEPPADGSCQKLSDGTMIIAAEKYQNEIWKSGEGLFLTGPGIPEDGIKPQDSIYVEYSDYILIGGHRRYFIEAKFEIPSASDDENTLSGYRLRILDFDKPLEFDLKRVPEYSTLEELAAEECGSLDTHDGISIISMGEKKKEGVLVSWYVYSEEKDRPISITYKPPLQEIKLPTISGNGKEYPIGDISANPYMDSIGKYRLSEVEQYGRRLRCLFEVPQEEQGAEFQINIPGITFLDYEESPEITLKIPEDYEEINEDIPWKEGSVRILGITRMKEPQTVEITDGQGKTKVKERPAVYIDVAAVHEEKDLELKGLICQRKLKWSGWEHERYDFNEKGNLSGFRIFYDEGDTEVTLKFQGAAFRWNQPYIMPLPMTE